MSKKISIAYVFAAFFAALIIMAGYSAAAYAQSNEPPTTEETPQSGSHRLTPEGNLTLVDDVQGEQAESKQFITAVTKSGNYFYLVIDRNGDKENVYLLNMVDEADLIALMEKDKKSVPVTQQPEPTPEPTPPSEQKNPAAGILVLVLLAAVIGGGALYYFKVLKPKQAVQGTTDLDELEFEDDEDETELITMETASTNNEDVSGAENQEDNTR